MLRRLCKKIAALEFVEMNELSLVTLSSVTSYNGSDPDYLGSELHGMLSRLSSISTEASRI